MTTKPAKASRLGRPPKLPPKDAAERIEELAANGFSVRGIAAKLSTTQDTMRKWFEADPNLQEAFEHGRERERHTLHNVLYRSATELGNITAAMFLLKARHGYREGDQSDQSSKVNITFTLPSAMSLKDYEVINHANNRNDDISGARPRLAGRT